MFNVVLFHIMYMKKHHGPSYFLVECEKRGLVEMVTAMRTAEVAHLKLQGRSQLLESQMADTQLRLNEECSKYHSAWRQQEVSVSTSLHQHRDHIEAVKCIQSVFRDISQAYDCQSAAW